LLLLPSQTIQITTQIFKILELATNFRHMEWKDFTQNKSFITDMGNSIQIKTNEGKELII